MCICLQHDLKTRLIEPNHRYIWFAPTLKEMRKICLKSNIQVLLNKVLIQLQCVHEFQRTYCVLPCCSVTYNVVNEVNNIVLQIYPLC